MSRDEGRTVLPDGSDNYETVVLDFLDKEMASVQPNKKKNEHSDELDALVSDLLKQVITESDQPAAVRPAAAKEMDDLLAEFPPTPVEVFPSHQGTVEIVNTSPAPATPEASPVAGRPQEAAQPAAAASLFATPAPAKSKTPMMALAAACLLAVIGGAVYYFTGSSKEAAKDAANIAESPSAPVTQSASNMARNTLPMTQPAASQPAAEPEASMPSEKPAPADERSAQPAKASTVKSDPVKPVASNSLSLPEVPQNEKPSMIQGSASIASTSTGSALDKLIAPSQTALDRPKPPAPVRSAAASKPSAAPSPVSGVLIPAEPISQVSPKYPALAVKTRASATVVLDLVIDAKGNVIDATPVSGSALFHKEAVDAAMKWRYRPASLGGVNVKSQARVTMNFKLK